MILPVHDRLRAHLSTLIATQFSLDAAALPSISLEYPPNRDLGDLGTPVAFELARRLRKAPRAIAQEIAAAFERNATGALEAAKSVSEEQWNAPAKFAWNGQVVWEDTVSGMAWGYLFDMIHHRGQLTAYLRPMGGKVPSCYGPTADDAG